MTNRFLTKTGTSVDLTDGSIPFYGSSLGAINLNTSKAVKTNNSGVLYSTNLQISDVDGLQTAINGALTNPASSDLNMNAKKIHNATDVSGSSNSLQLLSATDSVNLTLIDTKTEVNKPIDMKNNIIINGGPITASTATIPIIQGSADDLGNLVLRANSFAPNGTVSISNTTASNAYTSGALVVAGGLGVAGNIYTNGNINIGINSITSGSLTTTTSNADTLKPKTTSGAITVQNSAGDTIAIFNDNKSVTFNAVNAEGISGTSVSAGLGDVSGASATVTTTNTDNIKTKTASGNLVLQNQAGSTIATFNNDLSMTTGSISAGSSTITGATISTDTVKTKTASGNLVLQNQAGSTIATFNNDLSMTTGSISAGSATITGATISTDTVKTKTASGAITVQNSAGSTIATFNNDLSMTTGSISAGTSTISGQRLKIDIIAAKTTSGNVVFYNEIDSPIASFNNDLTTTLGNTTCGALTCTTMTTQDTKINTSSGVLTCETLSTDIVKTKTASGDLIVKNQAGSTIATFKNDLSTTVGALTCGAVSTNGGSLSCGTLISTTITSSTTGNSITILNTTQYDHSTDQNYSQKFLVVRADAYNRYSQNIPQDMINFVSSYGYIYDGLTSSEGDYYQGGGSLTINVRVPTSDSNSTTMTECINMGYKRTALNSLDLAVRIPITTAATSTTTGALQVAGGVGIGGNLHISGTATKPTDAVWLIFSDERIKEEIKDADLDMCCDTLKSVRVRRFKYKDEYIQKHGIIDTHRVGFVAQELKTALPKAVGRKYNDDVKPIGDETDVKWPEMTDENSTYTVNVDALLMASFGAIQKLLSEVADLKARITALENP